MNAITGPPAGENPPSAVDTPPTHQVPPKPTFNGPGSAEFHQATVEATPEFKARIMAMAAALPGALIGDGEPVPANLGEHRNETFRRAWRNSLDAAYVPELADTTLAMLDDDQRPQWLSKWVQTLGPNAGTLNLVIAGRVGAGKTAAAVATGNAAVDLGLLVRFVRHSAYVAMLRPEGSPSDLPDWQIRRRFRDCDLLILDDLGAGLDVDRAASRFVVDETLSLIGDRIASGRATIVTTNEKSDTLALMFTERVISRLSEHGHSIVLTSPDRRGRLSW